jgi:pyridoxine 5-phosphate synthase
MILLGVNVDHVATIREARKTYEPDPVWAAAEAELGGADLITVHLREDRRHIRDRDLRLLKDTVGVDMNLEMSLNREIVRIALEVEPDMVTLVPEHRHEITTEGGLDVAKYEDRIREVVDKFGEKNIPVSLFVEPKSDQLERAAECEARMVELHTGAYANASGAERDAELEKLVRGASVARKMELVVNAGHGLTYNNVVPVVQNIVPHELHIGHSIVSRAVFVGIRDAVREMKEVIFKSELLR